MITDLKEHVHRDITYKYSKSNIKMKIDAGEDRILHRLDT